jgi:hypothetical protein
MSSRVALHRSLAANERCGSITSNRACTRYFRSSPNFGHIAASQRDAKGTYLDEVGRRSSSGNLAKFTNPQARQWAGRGVY